MNARRTRQRGTDEAGQYRLARSSPRWSAWRPAQEGQDDGEAWHEDKAA